MISYWTCASKLFGVLAGGLISNLSFSLRYDPWLCFQPAAKGQNILLDAVRCSIAARHLSSAVRMAVSGRLQSLAHNMTAIHILDPDSMFSSPEVIQALTILGTWSHIAEVPQGGIGEARSIISSAVGMAMDLRINQLSSLPHAKESTELRAKTALVSGDQQLRKQRLKA